MDPPLARAYRCVRQGSSVFVSACVHFTSTRVRALNYLFLHVREKSVTRLPIALFFSLLFFSFGEVFALAAVHGALRASLPSRINLPVYICVCVHVLHSWQSPAQELPCVCV